MAAEKFQGMCVSMSEKQHKIRENWYNNMNSQLDATITNFIDNYNQLNMFRAIIWSILPTGSIVGALYRKL